MSACTVVVFLCATFVDDVTETADVVVVVLLAVESLL